MADEAENQSNEPGASPAPVEETAQSDPPKLEIPRILQQLERLQKAGLVTDPEEGLETIVRPWYTNHPDASLHDKAANIRLSHRARKDFVEYVNEQLLAHTGSRSIEGESSITLEQARKMLFDEMHPWKETAHLAVEVAKTTRGSSKTPDQRDLLDTFDEVKLDLGRRLYVLGDMLGVEPDKMWSGEDEDWPTDWCMRTAYYLLASDDYAESTGDLYWPGTTPKPEAKRAIGAPAPIVRKSAQKEKGSSNGAPAPLVRSAPDGDASRSAEGNSASAEPKTSVDQERSAFIKGVTPTVGNQQEAAQAIEQLAAGWIPFFRRAQALRQERPDETTWTEEDKQTAKDSDIRVIELARVLSQVGRQLGFEQADLGVQEDSSSWCVQQANYLLASPRGKFAKNTRNIPWPRSNSASQKRTVVSSHTASGNGSQEPSPRRVVTSGGAKSAQSQPVPTATKPSKKKDKKSKKAGKKASSGAFTPPSTPSSPSVSLVDSASLRAIQARASHLVRTRPDLSSDEISRLARQAV